MAIILLRSDTYACLEALLFLDGVGHSAVDSSPPLPTDSGLSGLGVTELGNTEISFTNVTNRRKSYIVCYALCNLLFLSLARTKTSVIRIPPHSSPRMERNGT